MWLEAGLARLVDEFWAGAPSGREPFPCKLAGSASLALPVVVRFLPGLTLDSMRAWLRARKLDHHVEVGGSNRRLRGCLLAYGGHAFVLVDGSDPEDEQRFTMAHELAHFLVDYREPRFHAQAVLGEEITPVLDGLRVPTRTERLHAALNGMTLGVYVDLFERTPAGSYTTRATLDAEERADRLAFELLAPAEDAWATVSALAEALEGHSYLVLRRKSAEALRVRYGLPEEQAQTYAAWLLKKGGRGPSFRDWLGET